MDNVKVEVLRRVSENRKHRKILEGFEHECMREVGDGLRAKGLVRLEIEKHLKGKKSEKKSQEGHNMLSSAALSMMAAKATEGLLGCNDYVAGRSIIKTTMYARGGDNSSLGSARAVRFEKANYALSCALLGINSAAYANIVRTQGFLPLLDSDGLVDVDAVRAVASAKSSVTGTDGQSAVEDSTSLIDIHRAGRKYSFPAETGLGNLTGVAMMAASAAKVGKVPFGGLRVCKRIDGYFGLTDKIAGARDFVPPGVDGNGLSVRMKFTTADSVTVHTRNLTTGNQTDGTGTEWFPTSASQVKYYFDDGTNIYFTDDGRYWYKADASTHAESSVVTFSNQSGDVTGFGAVKDSSDHVYLWRLIVRTGYSSEPYFRPYLQVRDVANNSTASYDSKSAIATWLSSTFGITVPSGLLSDNNVFMFAPITLGNYTGLYITFIDVSNTDNVNKQLNEVWVFTSGANVVGSLIDIITNVCNKSCLWGSGASYGVIDVGHSDEAKISNTMYNTEGYSGYSLAINLNNGNDEGKLSVSNGAETYTEDDAYGIYLSVQGQWSQWVSVKELEETVEKTETTDVKVEYDYAFSTSV